MKRWLLLILGTALVFGAEDGGRLGRLTLPLFDPAGRMTRRLTGEVSGTLQESKLTNAVVEFFSSETPEGRAVAWLELDAAVYRRAESAVRGPGELRFRSATEKVSGKDYRYDLTGDRFSLRNGFRIELADGTIEGREADVRLGWLNGDVVIEEFEARGNIVFIPKDPEVLKNFDRAHTERAWYAGSDDVLRLAVPVQTELKGVAGSKITEEAKFPLNLRRKR
jgi:hypothetical protein